MFADDKIPEYLKNQHYDSDDLTPYKYPHDYPNHYVEQQYLPDSLKGRTFWKAQDNDSETRIMNGLNARKKR